MFRNMHVSYARVYTMYTLACIDSLDSILKDFIVNLNLLLQKDDDFFLFYLFIYFIWELDSSTGNI